MSFKIIVAPNSFRGSLDAFEAARLMADGFKTVFPEAAIEQVPVADGGDGTMRVLQHFLGGEIMETAVLNPAGKTVSAKWLMLAGGAEAVIEMAAASGMGTLAGSDLAPLKATSYGTGQLVKAALDAGCRRITLGLGGSATVDAGAGLLQALGARLLDKNKKEIDYGGGALADLNLIDLTRLDSRLRTAEITAACDVDIKLCGPHGAARLFGPQKGATPEEAKTLDKNLRHFAGAVKKCLATDILTIKYGGAAGGIAATLGGVLAAELRSGIDLILDKIDFDKHLAGADLVITGEGKFDGQSLRGKAPLGVARAAQKRGLPVILIAGQIDRDLPAGPHPDFDAVFSTCTSPMSLRDSIENAPFLLERTAGQVAGILKAATGLKGL